MGFPGKEGFVFSPYNKKVVDVRGIPSGTLVADPMFPAQLLATSTQTAYKSDGTQYEERYQEFSPGQIMYGYLTRS